MKQRLQAVWKRAVDASPIRKVGASLLAVAIVIALMGYLNQHGNLYLGETLYNLLGDFYANTSTELVSIAITVLIIDALIQRREKEQEKRDLILQLGSPDNAFAREALRKIRARNWHNDGSLRKADLTNANLRKANLMRADLRGAHLVYADLENANLRDADLRRTALRSANLTNAIMASTDLRNAHLKDTDLVSANLRNADLRSANLWSADLRSANLTITNLENALLRSANLENAIMEAANLSGADLTKAYLNDADLTHAKISDTQLAKVESLEGATMPDGTVYDGRFDNDDE